MTLRIGRAAQMRINARGGGGVGDMNADGRPDLAVANLGSDDVSALLGNGDGSFRSAVGYGVADEPASVAVGD